MTDNDIKKALECCTYQHGRCTSCPLYAEVITGCQSTLFDNALDLINRQKAEIERLEEMFDSSVSSERNAVDNIGYEKSEAIKEFIDELKNRVVNKYEYTDIRAFKEIDNLVKEMTEVNEK